MTLFCVETQGVRHIFRHRLFSQWLQLSPKNEPDPGARLRGSGTFYGIDFSPSGREFPPKDEPPPACERIPCRPPCVLDQSGFEGTRPLRRPLDRESYYRGASLGCSGCTANTDNAVEPCLTASGGSAFVRAYRIFGSGHRLHPDSGRPSGRCIQTGRNWLRPGSFVGRYEQESRCPTACYPRRGACTRSATSARHCCCF